MVTWDRWSLYRGIQVTCIRTLQNRSKVSEYMDVVCTQHMCTVCTHAYTRTCIAQTHLVNKEKLGLSAVKNVQ